MTNPTLKPSALVISAAPGEPPTGSIRIIGAPADKGITASIEGLGTPFTVEQVVVYEQVVRPLNSEELENLPSHSPFLRARKAKDGSFVMEEVARSDGSTPLAMPKGATVGIEVRLAELPSSGIATATLVVQGASMDRIEVPIVGMSATPRVSAECVPAEISRVVAPKEVLPQYVTVDSAPAAATVVATLKQGVDAVRIQKAVVLEGERREWTDEELAQLYPPELRETARRDGYIEYHERGRVEAGVPLNVSYGARYQVFLEIAVPAKGAPDLLVDTLTIDSTSWGRIEVPVRIEVAGIEAAFSTESLNVRQGLESDFFDVTLTSSAGAATDVHFRLGHERDPFQVHPEVVHLPRGEAVTAPLRISVDPNPSIGAYPLFLGAYDLRLEVRAFGGLWTRHFPLKLTFLPGTTKVTALQSSAVALQGDRMSCLVQVSVTGGYKTLTFEAGGLPPGVRMDTLVSQFRGPSTTEVRLEFAVDPGARPVTNALATVMWSANDGEQTGAVPVTVTVLLRPETRTFSQPVLTPAGTALGGHAELVLSNDGSGRFRGHMRATGLFSYKFRVRAVVRSADGRLAVIAQKSGAAYGSDTPGDRQFNWDDNAPSAFVGDQWREIRTASIAVSKSYEMTGVLATVADVVVDVVEFVAAAALLNPVVSGAATLVGMILVGSELGEHTGVRIVGPGGLIGLVVAGGAAFLFGGGVLIPVFVGGVMVGDVEVKHRPLRKHEQSLAKQVFQDTLPLDRIVLTNLSGENGQEFVVPNVDGSILVNMGNGFSDPIGHKDPRRGFTEDGQIFIHELTHVWQVAHMDVVSELFWKAAIDKLGGSASYIYGPPGPAWSSFGLEQQATIVEEWFSGTAVRAAVPVAGRFVADPDAPVKRPTAKHKMQETDPYFGYIANNIRMEEP